jgi:acetyl-CoA carboxylase biotin carboxyl carrier protein
MDLGTIRKLVRLMESADLTELEIDDTAGGLRVHLRRGRDQASGAPPVVHVMPAAGGGMLGGAMPTMAPASFGGDQDGAAAGAEAAPAHPPGTQPFPSPMVGTFYRASSPDVEPFVSAGSAVDEETTLCIIEAMKVMNEVKAETRGEIVEVLVENGEPVEFGQPLFLIKPR